MELKDMNFIDNSKSIRENARIQGQAANFLKESQELEANKIASEAKEKEDKLMEAFAFSSTSAYMNSKKRVNSLKEEYEYNENASIIGMTEMITQVVKKGLLLDEGELKNVYPEYESEIKEIVSGFLREAEINESITNKDTLTIMEHVYNRLPSVSEGKNLTEDILEHILAQQKSIDTDAAINTLGENVQRRVAALMEKEQAKVKEVEAESGVPMENPEEAPAEEAQGGYAAEDIIAAIQNGELDPAELDQMAQNGEIDEDTYNQVIEALNGEAEGEEEMPQEEDPGMMGGMPKKQIQMTPDGMLSINIYESADQTQEEVPEEEMIAPRTQIQMDPEGNLLLAADNKQISIDAEGGMSIDIMEALDSELTNYVEYSDYEKLHEGITTDLDIFKWSPENEIEKKYTQKGRVIGSMLGWFFGGVIGVALKVSLGSIPGGGGFIVKLGRWIGNGFRKNPIQAGTEEISNIVKAPSTGSLIGTAIVGGAAGAAAGHYIGRKINARINRVKINALLKAAVADETCNSLMKDIRTAIENEDTESLKTLREKYAIRLDELKNVVESNITIPTKPKTIYTESLVKDIARCGLIESLAVNEAMCMIKEGKEYDSDLCLAKAIIYTTITEAMDEMGLMNIDDSAYRGIIEGAGGSIYESKKPVNKNQANIEVGTPGPNKILMTDGEKSVWVDKNDPRIQKI